MKSIFYFNTNLIKKMIEQVSFKNLTSRVLKMIYINGFILFLLGMQSCSDMNDLHNKYLDEGEHIYAEKIDTVVVGSGFERINLEMHINTESIKTARIFWNNENNQVDSVDVDINFQKGVFNKLITNLNEQQYIFKFINIDRYGNKSLPYEALGLVYGNNYINTIANRTILSLAADIDNEVFINWAENFDKKLDNCTLIYTDINGTEIEIIVPADELTTFLPGFASDLKYNTGFAPNANAIDVFYTDFVSVNTSNIILDNSNWSIDSFSTQQGGDDNKVANILDGNQNTRWHSKAGESNYPHWVIIDLGSEATFSKVEILRSTYDGGGDNRAPDKFTFEVSKDKITWVDMGEFNFNRHTNDGQFYSIVVSDPTRYVRFTGTEGGGGSNMVLGAIKLFK
ncbi:DUF4998 domain-containing protein [Mariniflexile litorale]|uniref:DUF4998 domain-containing protein n=1 Tax=Mariniflexile litorale TaxID=3045158 RepID=A0AAU7EHF9_9FLAO|nr:DUF4998 domain-containing protein [Mariniflexile sp. KMM 9835]MDQ8211934.1 DUF4998 domain-containing protein [Mariniflexile sp. KMM 9835]